MKTILAIAAVSILALSVVAPQPASARNGGAVAAGVIGGVAAGAIIGGADDTAAAKMRILEECGVNVVASPADIGKKMAEVLK